jgi:WD40 repeat-containing protein SMU1
MTTGACLHSIRPQEGIKAQLALCIPNDQYHRMVVIHSNNTASILNQKGKLLQTVEYKKASKFTTGTLSHQGTLLYVLSEESMIHCFDIASGNLVGESKVCDEEAIGISSHPFSNVVAINSEKRRIYLFKSTTE